MSKGQRVSFLIKSMTARAGTERVTASIASALAAQGHAVQILAIEGQTSAFPLHPGVTLTPLNIPASSMKMRELALPLIRALRRSFRARRPDVLVVVDSVLSVFALPASLGFGVRRIVWEHFHLHYKYGLRQRRAAHRLAAQFADDVVTLTERDAAQWRAAFPRARARIRAITNPLPFEVPPHNPYDPGHRTVLAVGRLEDQKGFDLLLQAWGRIEQQVPGWQLKIIGSGEQEAALRAQAAQLQLQRFTLAPATAQVQDEYRAAGAFCFSSRHEGLGMVLMESQAYGVPAVAFDCPIGPAELLVGGGGVLVPPEDVPGLAHALQTLLHDQPAREAMSALAFAHAPTYSAEQILRRWTELLDPPAPSPPQRQAVAAEP